LTVSINHGSGFQEEKLLPKLGETASITRKITLEDIEKFAELTGDTNPAHLDDEFAGKTRFRGRIAHGMWTGALISAVLGTRLPGPGTIYISQTMKFKGPVYPGDEVTAKVTVTEVDEEKSIITLETICLNQGEKAVLVGDATVLYESDGR
jgi:acyl dehydratase